MKAIVSTLDGKYRLEEVDIPSPGSGEVLIKVEAAAQNPADWKNLSLVPEGHILGYDFSGTVHEIGPDVDKGLRYVGERVSGFVHGGATRNGAFAEFVAAQAGLLIRLPDEISFENGAGIALASITACLSLYRTLDLPIPFDPPSSSPPGLVVWSGSTSVGRYVIQLAKLAGLHIVATASTKQSDDLKALGADQVFDYSDSFTGRDIFEATGGNVHHAVDCWSEGMSPYQVSESLSSEHGKIATLLPYKSRKKGIETSLVSAYPIFGKDVVFPFASPADAVAASSAKGYAKLISRLLAEGKLKFGPVKVFPRGLESVVDGMEHSRLGKVHAEKIVYRISDTPGL